MTSATALKWAVAILMVFTLPVWGLPYLLWVAIKCFKEDILDGNY